MTMIRPLTCLAIVFLVASCANLEPKPPLKAELIEGKWKTAVKKKGWILPSSHQYFFEIETVKGEPRLVDWVSGGGGSALSDMAFLIMPFNFARMLPDGQTEEIVIAQNWDRQKQILTAERRNLSDGPEKEPERITIQFRSAERATFRNSVFRLRAMKLESE